MTYLIADMYVKDRLDDDDALYADILSHLGIRDEKLYYPTKFYSWNEYVNVAMQWIEQADRIADIRTHDDPWDRRHGFESNVEFDYALLIGKAIECIPFRVEDDK